MCLLHASYGRPVAWVLWVTRDETLLITLLEAPAFSTGPENGGLCDIFSQYGRDGHGRGRRWLGHGHTTASQLDWLLHSRGTKEFVQLTRRRSQKPAKKCIHVRTLATKSSRSDLTLCGGWGMGGHVRFLRRSGASRGVRGVSVVEGVVYGVRETIVAIGSTVLSTPKTLQRAGTGRSRIADDLTL